MKKLPILTVFSSLVIFTAFLVSPSSAHAASGPVGLNNLRAEAGPGAGQITLNWHRYNSDVTGYSIQYGTAPGRYVYGVTNTGNVVTYTVGSLTPGVRYYFLITPYRNGQIDKSVSPEISEVALSTPHTVIGTAGPYSPRRTTATSGPAAGQVTLTWNKLLPNVNNYGVVYGLLPGQYIYGANNIGDTTKFTIGGLSSGTRYYFALIPQLDDGTGIYVTAEVSQVAR